MHVPVVVITALSLECRAVCAHLTNLDHFVSPSRTVFELGTIATASRGNVQVAVAEIGAGNSNAGIETALAIAALQPSVVLFVGVAGGIKDVVVGDVIAGTKIYGYESGKAEPGFRARPEVFSSSWSLEQKARQVARRRAWLTRIEGSAESSAVNAKIGPMCAGEKVVSSTRSDVYRFIRTTYGDALAVEMEGRGFLEAARRTQVDAMVVRGVSDLLDGKSVSDAGGSQELAAAHAAAFAAELLSQLEFPNLDRPAPTSGIAKPEANPYRGLQYFDVPDAPYFFGREALTDALVRRVQELLSASSGRLVGIVGPSGSGKSSIARAGLVAQLKSGALTGSGHWPVISLRPGSDPIESLAVAVTSADRSAAPSLRVLVDDLAADDRTLHLSLLSIAAAHQQDSRVILLIDQFEEIFTLCDEESQREAFLNNVLYAVKKRGGPAIVVLTLRADQYHRCGRYHDLAEALSSRHVLVGPLSASEARAAIEQPAQLCGRRFEPGLVDRLIGDAMRQPGDLPLLQHALFELWSRQVDGFLTHAAYTDIGGIEGAMIQRAEKVYATFNDDERRLCRLMFVRLSQAGETFDTRQPVPADEIVPASFPTTMGDKVIAAFTHPDARLLVVSGSATEGVPLVEVAHEALLRSWPRLSQWLSEDREAHRFHRELTHAARSWDVNQREDGYLLRGEGLRSLAVWMRDHADEMSALERAFVQNCARLAAESLLSMSRESVPAAVRSLWVSADLVLPEVRSLLGKSTRPEDERRLRLALTYEDRDQVTALAKDLTTVDPAEHALLLEFLERHPDILTGTLWPVALGNQTMPTALVRACAALAYSDPENASWNRVAEPLAQAVLLENQLHFGHWMEAFHPVGRHLIAPLQSVVRDPGIEESKRHTAATALAALAKSAVPVADILPDAPPVSFDLLLATIESSPESDAALNILREKALGNPDSSVAVSRKRAAATATLLRLGRTGDVERILSAANDTELFTQFANHHTKQGLTIDDLSGGLARANSSQVRYIFLQALGVFDPGSFDRRKIHSLSSDLLSYFATDHSSAVHSAAGWLLRKWGLGAEVQVADRSLAGAAVSDEWFVVAHGEKTMTMIAFAPTTFTMGSPEGEALREADERQHEVRLATPYAICDRLVTRREFNHFLGETGEQDTSSDAPIADVTWHQAVDYCAWLTAQTNLPVAQAPYGSVGMRLPTEAEWEFACRAGTPTSFSFGNDMELLREYAWYSDNSAGSVQPTGILRPNPRGLFDVHGNVYEWCHDWHAGYPTGPAMTDPTGPTDGDRRVVRGGCWFYDGRFCRSSYRGDTRFPTVRYNDIGFRVAVNAENLRSLGFLGQGDC